MNKIKVINGLVSCLLPAYNTEKYVYECLESLKNQDYEMIELIVVNDGSTDGTPDEINRFCENYQDRFYNIEVINHAVNKGLISAINSGLGFVHGEFLMWFDSDDTLCSDNISAKVEYLNKHPEIICVLAEADSFNAEGNLELILGRNKVVGNWFDSCILGFCDMSPGINLCYTNSLLEALPSNGIRLGIKEQNWYMITSLAAIGGIGHLDKIVYHYRVREDSDSHVWKIETSKDFKKYWDMIDFHRYSVLSDCKLPNEYKLRAYSRLVRNSMEDRISTLDMDLYHDEKEYVDVLIELFMIQSSLKDKIKGRDIYIWGSDTKKRNMAEVLRRYFPITGFVNSKKSVERDVVCGQNIDPNRMFIYVPLLYHQDILKQLEDAGYKNKEDYYYPKADLYLEVLSCKTMK